MTTASDWQDPIFGLEPREPVRRSAVLALVVVSAVMVGSAGVALSTPQTEDAPVSRPAPTPLRAIAPLAPPELVPTAPPVKKVPVERKTRPAPDVLGERL